MQSIVPLNLNHSSISATPVPESSVAGPSTAGPSAATVSANKRKQDRERACDACRRRKTRCDGSRMPNNVCTNCLQTKKSCTYIEISKPRGPPKAYVVGLEDRLEKMEALLRRLRPEADFSAELGPPVVRGSWRTDAPYDSQPPTNASSVSFTPSIPYPSLPSLTPLPASKRGHSTDYFSEADSWASDEYSSDEEDEIAQHLTKNMKRLNILELDPGDKGNRLLDSSVRFHGSSSAFRLVNATRELQTQHLLETAAVEDDPSPGDLNGFPDVPMEGLDLHSRRGEYWQAPVWELDYEGVHITSPKVFPNLQQSWPPVDLAQTLIDLYFQHYNSMFPLLHYPTFAKHFTDKLYERDIWFACVCMSVFALGSRHSYDERVLPDDPSQYTSPPDDERLKWQQAGMKFFLAATDVIVAKRSMVTPTGLFEVQTLCLAAQYQADTRWHTGAWLMVGIGVRKAEDVGAHRKKSYGTTGPSVEDELWKRAWWHLVAFDRIRSAMLGLPCATREEDYDAELPLEVDDEYWENEDPALAFKQPSGKPSMVTGYNIWLRLSDILAYVMRVFCAPDSMDSVMGVTGPRRPENILNQLNERLLEWTKIVPEHLRWSPDIQNPVFANQSATLYITYNITAILIRCAILPPSSPRLKGVIHPDSPEDDLYTRSLSSLAIAVNAARAGTRIIEVIRLRGLSNIPMLISASDICASVLGLHIWLHRAKENRRRMKGLEPNLQTIQTVDSLMADLDSLLEGLEWATPRWENAEPMLRQLIHLKNSIPSAEDDDGLVTIDPLEAEGITPLESEYADSSQYPYGIVNTQHLFSEEHPLAAMPKPRKPQHHNDDVVDQVWISDPYIPRHYVQPDHIPAANYMHDVLTPPLDNIHHQAVPQALWPRPHIIPASFYESSLTQRPQESFNNLPAHAHYAPDPRRHSIATSAEVSHGVGVGSMQFKYAEDPATHYGNWNGAGADGIPHDGRQRGYSWAGDPGYAASEAYMYDEQGQPYISHAHVPPRRPL